MGRKNKLKKFAAIRDYPNVVENLHPSTGEEASVSGTDPHSLNGKWGSEYFHNDHPITLELACGKGEYTVQLARQYPQRNFIGVDIKGARIWKGATEALELQLPNVAFLRTRIELLDQFFAKGEVNEIWITFPDPFLRNSHAQKRLSSDRFLEIYRRILPAGARIQIKTDDPELYAFSAATWTHAPDLTVVYADDDIYSKPLPLPELAIKTFYEKMHLEAKKTIKYLAAIYQG
ncbi:MAG: tRNA (guanosine(46)-N7)-methyltransferase TrmB [Saprospiraceae bacterium]|nr:tRNA (guanosine(46)-N7)-methyltransferase TrmB [Saprospiraceae bacterium]MCB9321569.1 tRNA (guanosine(46)-N7)-methyltransferase TrmB [Lewinellaceae bacterium]